MLDLAAGTGVLTRPLLEAGLEVVAVEPVAEMRRRCPPSARALEGTAEAIPLDAGSVDAVVVGQAFHWFDGDAALAEIHRVLRPEGLLALFWNRRVDERPGEPGDRRAGRARTAANVPTHRRTPGARRSTRTSLFAPLSEHEFAERAAARRRRDGGARGLDQLHRRAGRAERKRVLERARAIAGEGTVTVPYRAEVQIWRRS